VALVPLVLLADVDDERVARIDQLARTARVDLGDLVANLLKQVSIAGHCFPKYSRAPCR
jgi:hypothetical protein